MSNADLTSPEAPGSDQSAVIAFLSDPTSYAAVDANAAEPRVERHDTHGAHVFLHGGVALKIKRAVSFDYMDFSSLEKRRVALTRELSINRVNAPDIYVDVLAINRGPDGNLRFDGPGETVEWALRMRRFPQSALLSRIASSKLDKEVLKALADAIYASHLTAEKSHSTPASLLPVVEQVYSVLKNQPEFADRAAKLRAYATRALTKTSVIRERRARAGFVRRCHGDLHLANIILLNNRPVLFDAIEFNEAIATIDTLYDLAFALMDLDFHAGRGPATIVLNHYLWRSRQDIEIEGLAALPVFLALRAGVRAMVTAQRARVSAASDQASLFAKTDLYLDLAVAYLKPATPVLVAVGGRSGTGKSTLSAAIAPRFRVGVGALHLRSDLERKSMRNVDEVHRLPASAYTPAESAKVYDALQRKAALALEARHSVIVDAVFANEDERQSIERVASEAGVPFIGIWLDADTHLLVSRVNARVGDASDATAAIVTSQSPDVAAGRRWHQLDATGAPELIADRACAIVRAAIAPDVAMIVGPVVGPARETSNI